MNAQIELSKQELAVLIRAIIEAQVSYERAPKYYRAAHRAVLELEAIKWKFTEAQEGIK